MGVFKLLHNDHLEYILAAKARCKRLVVGITNPDPTLTREDAADRNRSSRTANPLSYYERMLMTEAALLEAGVPYGGLSHHAVAYQYTGIIPVLRTAGCNVFSDDL